MFVVSLKLGVSAGLSRVVQLDQLIEALRRGRNLPEPGDRDLS
jgi:hypothetical protein